MRIFFLLLMSVILCEASCFAKDPGASSVKLDTARIRQDWPKIVDYVAVVYAQTVIEQNPQAKKNKERIHTKYKDNVWPDGKIVEVGVDGVLFLNQVLNVGWDTVFEIVSRKMQDLKMLRPDVSNLEKVYALLEDTKYTKEEKDKYERALSDAQNAIRQKIEKEYEIKVAEVKTAYVPDSKSEQAPGFYDLLASFMPYVITGVASVLLCLLLSFFQRKKQTAELESLRKEIRNLRAKLDHQPVAVKTTASDIQKPVRPQSPAQPKAEPVVQDPKPQEVAGTSSSSVVERKAPEEFLAKLRAGGILVEDSSAKAIFTICQTSADRGTFRFSGDEKLVLGDRDSYLQGVCDMMGSGRNRIVNVENGEVQRQGDGWRIVRKAKVRFE